MDDRFEQEFYRSPWHRVLPVGPGGIQPYVRPGRRSGRVAGLQHRLAGMLRALAQGLGEVRDGLGAFGAFGRWGAFDRTKCAILTPATRPGRRPSVRTPRAAPRRVRKAA